MIELIRRSDALDVIRNNGINSDGLAPRRDGDILGLCFLDGLNALPAVAMTFTKADVEAVARAIAEHMEGGLEFDEMPHGRVELRIWAREGMCDVNNATKDEALEAANAALSALGEVEG